MKASAVAFVLFASLPLPWESARADFEEAMAALAAGDFEHALPQLEALGRDGDPRAQDAMAAVYLEGIGVDADVPRAMGWYCRVAHQPEGGRPVMQAVWRLAEFFRTGGGVPGRRYSEGRLEDEDPLRAYFWFSIMAEQKSLYEQVDDNTVTLGKIGVNSLARVLFEEERTALGEAVAGWRPTRPVTSGADCLRLPDGLIEEQ